MLYREAGQFKTSYAADQAIFAIAQDRVVFLLILAIGFVVVPLVASEYALLTIMIPFLVFSLAAIGLNLLTGYAGQVSLGTGGFMAVGAFAAFKLATSFPGLDVVVVFLLAGSIAAAVGVVFGLPTLRIKVFYSRSFALAAQFLPIWMFNKFPWFFNYSPWRISAPPRTVFGLAG
jgi:branched-chain amino acid transport system permease protein